jgi:fumarate reductase subunit C
MNPDYKVYHPRWHRDRLPIFWWLSKPAYTRFISRELTSVAVGYAAVLILVHLWTASRGDAAWERLHSWIGSGPAIVLHVLVLAVLVFHSITWLNLAPRAMVLRLGGRRLPEAAVLGLHYAGWAVASALAAWLLVGRA